MKNAFRPGVLELVTQMGMGVLIDRLGGSVVVGQADRDALAEKFGGGVAIKIEEVEPLKSYRLTLVAAKKPDDVPPPPKAN